MWVVSHTVHTIFILIICQVHNSVCVYAIIELSAITEMNTKDKKYENKLRIK